MKTIIKTFLLSSIVFTACNDNAKTSASVKSDSPVSKAAAGEMANNNSAIDGVVTGYLDLKNALSNDDSKNAAASAESISESLKKVDENSLSTAEQKKVYKDVEDDLVEDAEHITKNADRIAHQREHFESMSNDLYDLIKVVKPGRTLYKDFCPMYNEQKGGMWLSETKEIKNPYLGKGMPECGEVQEVINK